MRGRVLAAEAASQSGASGIAGVMVSNGREVVLTGSHGTWQLPALGGDMIFVIKPANWTYAERAGVPTFSHRVTAADDGEPIDFNLRPAPEPERFDVLLLADTQAANARELSYVRDELAYGLRDVGAAFAINHGDVMGDDLALLEPYREFLKATGMVWHHAPGNHDMDLGSADPRAAFETWKRVLGPTHYAFCHARAVFIVLNNVEYFGAGAEPHEGRLYRGRIGRDQLAFVANVLAHIPKDHLVVVSMHIPLVSFEDPQCAADNTADRDELMRLLSTFQHTVSFSGHSHTTEHHYLGREDGYDRDVPHHHHVLTAFCGGWWGGPPNARGIPVSDSRDGSPRGYHVLTVDGNTYATRFVPMGDVEHQELRMRFDAAAADAGDLHQKLLIDVFDGGPRTRITCEWSGSGHQVELGREAIADPHIVESYAQNRDLLKSWVAPAPSSHMWAATIPAALKAAGCVVRVRNEYGRETLLKPTA